MFQIWVPGPLAGSLQWQMRRSRLNRADVVRRPSTPYVSTKSKRAGIRAMKVLLVLHVIGSVDSSHSGENPARRRKKLNVPDLFPNCCAYILGRSPGQGMSLKGPEERRSSGRAATFTSSSIYLG